MASVIRGSVCILVMQNDYLSMHSNFLCSDPHDDLGICRPELAPGEGMWSAQGHTGSLVGESVLKLKASP
jgi:hypothetical protein